MIIKITTVNDEIIYSECWGVSQQHDADGEMIFIWRTKPDGQAFNIPLDQVKRWEVRSEVAEFGEVHDP